MLELKCEKLSEQAKKYDRMTDEEILVDIRKRMADRKNKNQSRISEHGVKQIEIAVIPENRAIFESMLKRKRTDDDKTS